MLSGKNDHLRSCPEKLINRFLEFEDKNEDEDE